MSDLPYRPCVGMMLLNAQGLVFVAKRIDQTVEAWQMPQGGVDEGEDPKAAAFRELKEEIGTDNALVLREHPNWLFYDLPPHLVGIALKGKFRGQKIKFFAMRFLGEDKDIDLATPEPEFSDWRWAEITELPRLIVPFKRAIYQDVADSFADLARP